MRSTYVKNKADATFDDKEDLDYNLKGIRIMSMVWRMIPLMLMMIRMLETWKVLNSICINGL